MTINKNGMRSTAFKQANNNKVYDMQAVIRYCKTKGVRIEDLTPEELARFEIK